MASNYTQAQRLLSVTTPLGRDALLLVGLSGTEGLSQLFRFQLDLLAENGRDIAFDRLLGQKVTVLLALPDNQTRYLSGICSRFAQGEQDTTLTAYQMEIVPKFWLLTRRAQSRIFQQKSVPDILKKVLEGLDVTYEIQGTFPPRDYCVQYRETDFAFACRLMEEEGIFWFFKHSADGHKMLLANTPQSHPDLPVKSQIIYETMAGGNRPEDRVHEWQKVQELRSGKVTLWDHCFELPHKHLEAEKPIQESVPAGTVAHKLKVGGNDKLELYDYPGGYAQRFDGVAPGGGDRAGDLQKIFEDNKRTAEVRMQQEAAPGLVVHGSSNCRQFVSGHKFTLERHFNANGAYVLTSVQHSARLTGEYRSGQGAFEYVNRFTCIPAALPFRPPRETPRPFVQGTQTAVVVGPAGEEIFTDKYGRVKVQFHWDRDGKNNADSSCWVRVGTPWAGKQWGMIHIPRIGQEVVVGFEEGDPDRPIVLGSVYNADQMPPYKLPDNKTQSGLKSRSSLKGGDENFNEISFEDKKGEELLYIRAEKDLTHAVENDQFDWVAHDRTVTVDNDETLTVNEGNRLTTIEKGNDKHQIKKGNREVLIDMGNDTLTIKMGNQTTKLNLGKSETEALQSIELKVGQSSIKLDQTGVTIKGMLIQVEGTIQTQVKGLITQVTGDALLQAKGAITMIG